MAHANLEKEFGFSNITAVPKASNPSTIEITPPPSPETSNVSNAPHDSTMSGWMGSSDEIYDTTTALKHSLPAGGFAVGVIEKLTKTEGTKESGSEEEVVLDTITMAEPSSAHCSQMVDDERMQPVSWSSDAIVTVVNVESFGSNIAEQLTEPNHNSRHYCEHDIRLSEYGTTTHVNASRDHYPLQNHHDDENPDSGIHVENTDNDSRPKRPQIDEYFDVFNPIKPFGQRIYAKPINLPIRRPRFTI